MEGMGRDTASTRPRRNFLQLFEREDENIDICCEHDVLMVFMYSMNQRIENDRGNNLNCWRLP